MNIRSLLKWARVQAKRSRGATAVEYSILAAFIAAVIVGVLVVIGPQLLPGFQSVSGGI